VGIDPFLFLQRGYANPYLKPITMSLAFQDLPLNATQITKAASLLRAVDHPLRQQILQLLHQRQKMIVSNLYRELAIEQSVASAQLAILREAGIVRAERSNRNIFYSVHYQNLAELHQKLGELIVIGME
jgi:DNA-binding transcriptional ArsR family regulator